MSDLNTPDTENNLKNDAIPETSVDKTQEDIQAIIEEVKNEQAQVDTHVDTMEDKKAKTELNTFFTKTFSERFFHAHILKRIFILKDREFVQAVVTKQTSIVKGKEKTYYAFDKTKLEQSDIIRLNKIANEIKKQGGRVNFLPLIAALVTICLIFVFAYFFRNKISYHLVVNASEKAFGAKCDIGFIDFNLFETHFTIKDYAIANKDFPMKNICEIKNIDIQFNLLELSRGKFVCENIAIDGIRWNTDRKTSGALPASQNTKSEINSFLENMPLMVRINEELDAMKNGISLSNGLYAVREMTDPRLIIERNIARFQSPRIKDEILNFIPVFLDKWESLVEKTKQDIVELVERGKNIVEVDFDNMKVIEEIQTILTKINEFIDLTKIASEKVKYIVGEIREDAENIKNLVTTIEEYLKNDFEQVKTISANIKEFQTNGIGGFVSELVRVFYLRTLGSYYPRFIALLSTLSESQTSTQIEKKPSLMDKSRMLERLDGRNFLFSDRSAPSLLFKNIQVSAQNADNSFSIAAAVQNLTNDADKLNKPVTISLHSTQDEFVEHISGIVDLRTRSDEFVDVAGDFAGLNLDLNSHILGLPSLTGAFETSAKLVINKNNDLQISTSGVINNAVLELEAFEPEFISNIYREVLSYIHTIDLHTVFTKPVNSDFSLDIHTTVDNQIFEGIKKRLALELKRIKDLVIEEGKRMLEKIRTEYISQIAYGNEVLDAIQLAVTDSDAFLELLKQKQKEADARIKQLTAEKISDTANKIKDKIIDSFPFW